MKHYTFPIDALLRARRAWCTKSLDVETISLCRRNGIEVVQGWDGGGGVAIGGRQEVLAASRVDSLARSIRRTTGILGCDPFFSVDLPETFNV